MTLWACGKVNYQKYYSKKSYPFRKFSLFIFISFFFVAHNLDRMEKLSATVGVFTFVLDIVCVCVCVCVCVYAFICIPILWPLHSDFSKILFFFVCVSMVFTRVFLFYFSDDICEKLGKILWEIFAPLTL